MAFKEMGGSTGDVLKWEKPGQVVEGVVRAVKNGKVFNGKQSRLAVIGTAAGDVTIPLTTVLDGRFAENGIRAGHVVRITYTGKEKSKAGVEFKAFKFEVDDSVQPHTAAPPVTRESALSAPHTPTGEFDALAERLNNKVGAPAAAAMLNALVQLYPDYGDRLAALKQAVQQQGA